MLLSQASLSLVHGHLRVLETRTPAHKLQDRVSLFVSVDEGGGAEDGHAFHGIFRGIVLGVGEKATSSESQADELDRWVYFWPADT
jgi:hypothetical protein